jgi:hypothetical protein
MKEDRRAAKRERVQLARNYLRHRDLSWIINLLLEKGPMTEMAILFEVPDEWKIEDACRSGRDALGTLYSLWLVGKLWRKGAGVHPGCGEKSFIYGIRRVHKRP